MTQFIAVLSFMLMSVGLLGAQDLPPLPPAASDTGTTTASSPSGTASDSSAAAPALPPLPSSNSDTSGAASNPSAALPPLPGSADSSTNTSANSSEAMPTLPASANQAATDSNATTWSSPNLTTPASGPTSALVVPDVPKTVQHAHHPKHHHKLTPAEQYRVDHYRPNVIYGGWVWTKGGSVDDKLAWTSQEILDALVPKGYTVLKEDGNYDGEDTTIAQWRQWTFSIPHSHVVSQVYIKPVKHRIWVRVGPSEPPAGESLKVFKAYQKEDLKMLRLLRKKLGHRLTPHHRKDWTALYNYESGTSDQ
ncbi:MAG: hypothetical protein ACREL1_00185 [bacterium]